MSSTGRLYDLTAAGVTDAGCSADVPDDVSPSFEGRGDFITVFALATPNKNTSGMTSLFARVAMEARVRLSVRVCLRRPARSHVPPLPVWAPRLRLYPHGRTRLKPACLPGARAYQSIRSSVCLLAVCPESTYFAPQLRARPSATPGAATVSSNTVLSAFFSVFISVRHNQALHRATHTHTHTGNHSTSAHHLISASLTAAAHLT
ncbi:hypothetical protein ROHU_035266 [Labeo rohita]|uniref:Uncharacterized protein n=1 Tax=Labeo rohita TaxID=84645 RepID=A0A498LNH1_LABRO|nr:hypothetical protein ROHU_035266 [Labeo rohita]